MDYKVWSVSRVGGRLCVISRDLESNREWRIGAFVFWGYYGRGKGEYCLEVDSL